MWIKGKGIGYLREKIINNKEDMLSLRNSTKKDV